MGRVSTANSGCATPRAKVVPGLAGRRARRGPRAGRRRARTAAKRLAPVVRARDLRPARRVSNAASSKEVFAPRGPPRAAWLGKRASRAPRGGSGRPFAGLERSTGRRGSSTLSAGSKHPGSRARRPGDSGDRGIRPFGSWGRVEQPGRYLLRTNGVTRILEEEPSAGALGDSRHGRPREYRATPHAHPRCVHHLRAPRRVSPRASSPPRDLEKPGRISRIPPSFRIRLGISPLVSHRGGRPPGTRASSDRDRPPRPQAYALGPKTRAEEGRKTCQVRLSRPPPSPRRSLRLPPLVFAPPRVVAPLPIDFRVVGFEPAPPRASRVPPFAPPARSRALERLDLPR